MSKYHWELQTGSEYKTYVAYDEKSNLNLHIIYRNKVWELCKGFLTFGTVRRKDNAIVVAEALQEYVTTTDEAIKNKLASKIAPEIIKIADKALKEGLFSKTNEEVAKVSQSIKIQQNKQENIAKNTILENEQENTTVKKKMGRPKTGRKYFKYWLSPEENEAVKLLIKRLREVK